LRLEVTSWFEEFSAVKPSFPLGVAELLLPDASTQTTAE